MPKAFGYVRVSTDEQFNHATSIAAQAAQIMHYAASPGNELDLGDETELPVGEHTVKSRARILIESSSAYKIPFLNRPAGQYIFGELERGDTLIIAKVDRAFRNQIDGFRVLEQLRDKGIKVAILDMGGMDPHSATGEVMFGMFVVFARWESRRRSERLTEAARARKMQGRINPSKTPPLMRWMGKGKGTRPEFCWEEYEIAKRAVQLWIDGMSIPAICGLYRREGVHVPRRRAHEYNRWGSEYNEKRMRGIINGLLWLRQTAETMGVEETDKDAILRWMNEYGTRYEPNLLNFPKQHLRKGAKALPPPA